VSSVVLISAPRECAACSLVLRRRFRRTGLDPQ
jgi:hypothetical protein